MKMRTVALLTALLMLFYPLLTAIRVYAAVEDDTVVIVTSKTATIRKSPSNSGVRIAAVHKDEEYAYLDEVTKGGNVTWYHVRYNKEKTGWISGKYAEKRESGSQDVPDELTITVLRTSPVYRSADTGSEVIHTAHENDRFRIVSRTVSGNKEYYEIRLTSDTTGWIPAGDTDKAASAETPPEIPEDCYYARINNKLVNIRSGPGFDYPIIGLAYKDAEYPLITKETDRDKRHWLNIKLSDESDGWISEDYASVERKGASEPVVTLAFSGENIVFSDISGISGSNVWDGKSDVSFKAVPESGYAVGKVIFDSDLLQAAGGDVYIIKHTELKTEADATFLIRAVAEKTEVPAENGVRLTVTGSDVIITETENLSEYGEGNGKTYQRIGSADISVTAKAVDGYLISGSRVYDSDNNEILRSVCDEAVPSLDIHITAETLRTDGEFTLVIVTVKNENWIDPAAGVTLAVNAPFASVTDKTGVSSNSGGVYYWDRENDIVLTVTADEGYVIYGFDISDSKGHEITCPAIDEAMTSVDITVPAETLRLDTAFELTVSTSKKEAVPVDEPVYEPAVILFDAENASVTEVSGAIAIDGKSFRWDGENSAVFKAEASEGWLISGFTVRDSGGGNVDGPVIESPVKSVTISLPAELLRLGTGFTVSVTAQADETYGRTSRITLSFTNSSVNGITGVSQKEGHLFEWNGRDPVHMYFRPAEGYEAEDITLTGEDGANLNDFEYDIRDGDIEVTIPVDTLCGHEALTLTVTCVKGSGDEEPLYVAISGNSVILRNGPGSSYEDIARGYIGDYYPYVDSKDDQYGTTWHAFQYDEDTVLWTTNNYSALTPVPPNIGIDAIDAIAKTYGVRSMQIALIKDGRVTDGYSFGYATKNTDLMTNDHNLRIASLSKVITAMNMMRAQELGYLDIDEDISGYWGFDIKNPNNNRPITLRNIFTHTSSIKSLDYSNIASQLKDSSSFRNVVPGTAGSWAYNNYAVGVGGDTVERAMIRTINDFMDEQFNAGLGIDASFAPGRLKDKRYATLYRNSGEVARTAEAQAQNMGSNTPGSDTNAMYFAGGYTGSASDVAKMLAVLANKGAYDGKRYLTEESVNTMLAEYCTASEHGGTFGQCIPMRHVYNYCGANELYYHTANAYGLLGMGSFDPQTRNGVVVLTIGAAEARDAQGVYSACSEITRYCYENLM